MNESCKVECSYHAWILIMYYVGVTAKDVDVVELHDCFSTNELITYEALVSYPTECKFLDHIPMSPLDVYMSLTQ